MEDRARRKRHFRALHSLGSNEYSFRRSCTLFGAASRHQRWTIRFCLRTPSRFRASGETLRSTRKWEKSNSPLPARKFRKLKVVWKGPALHLDDKLWPKKKQSGKYSSEIEITVKPSALIILQPAPAVKT